MAVLAGEHRVMAAGVAVMTIRLATWTTLVAVEEAMAAQEAREEIPGIRIYL